MTCWAMWLMQPGGICYSQHGGCAACRSHTPPSLTHGLSTLAAPEAAWHASWRPPLTPVVPSTATAPRTLLPPSLAAAHPCTLHGVATWFDVLFDGSTSQRWLSTAPGLPATHWFQLRCVLQQPLVVLTPNSRLSGCLHLVAHERQSYDIHLELEAPPVGPGMPAQKVGAGGADVWCWCWGCCEVWLGWKWRQYGCVGKCSGLDVMQLERVDGFTCGQVFSA